MDYGKQSCLIDKSTISMAIFHSYVKLPEGSRGYGYIISPPLRISFGRVTVREVGLGSRQSHGPTLGGQQVGHQLHPVLPGFRHGKHGKTHGQTMGKPLENMGKPWENPSDEHDQY